MLENLLKGDAPVGPKSYETYAARVKMLERASGASIEQAMSRDVRRVIASLRAEYKRPSTLKSLGTTVMSMYAHSPEFARQHKSAHATWRAFLSAASHRDQDARDDNRATPDQRARTPRMHEIRDAMAKLKRGGLRGLKESQQHLLLSMCVDIPPKRLDLGSLLVVETRRKGLKGNYLIVGGIPSPISPSDGSRLPRKYNKMMPSQGAMGEGNPPPVTLVMQEYKTSKTYGRHEEDLPESMGSDIRASLAAFPRAHLFVGADGGPMSDGAYAKFLTRTMQEHVGKAATVNTIRHMYITETVVLSKMTRTERRAVAAAMNHSLDIQGEYHQVGIVGVGESLPP